MSALCWKCNTRPLTRGFLCVECHADEAEETRRKALSLAQRSYEDMHGREAQERQTKLAGERWTCCGESREGPHHEACAKYVEPVEIHPDQVALL